ncbi:hypothetical protein [Pedobacter metabolipauper]|uniref:Uncharacterized protein n=1 Tax=Pedobacter metabolipauper TaxID=425513 RepID=A0A4R6SSW0_9SPHI|nr:hypothetical protein [Pedobacter metabolipauper]TDQ07485.1 hypothetical protein ATK78_3611 [Pedobacter metabolipauper]
MPFTYIIHRKATTAIWMIIFFKEKTQLTVYQLLTFEKIIDSGYNPAFLDWYYQFLQFGATMGSLLFMNDITRP